MNELWAEIVAYFSTARLMTVLRVAIILLVGWLLARGIGWVLTRGLRARRAGAHQEQLARRAVRYAVLVGTLLIALSELGVDLGVLLGAAGVLTVAVGFASQSSAANVISGLFLLGERSFSVGDTLQVAGTTGEVLSVDLMSIKLRTFDNVFVRIPNELLLKTELRNLSRFPIRRLDLPLTIAYADDFERVRDILREVALANPFCLEEPRPLVLFTGFGDNGYTIQYSVWVAQEHFIEVKASLHGEVVRALDGAKIAIPMPRHQVQLGPGPAPLAVRLVADAPALEPAAAEG